MESKSSDFDIENFWYERMLSIGRAEELPGDFWKDGILFCGKCREAKETTEDFGKDARGNDRTVIVKCNCRCERERVEKERFDRERRERNERAEQIREDCIKEKSMREARFDKAKRSRQLDICWRYVAKWSEMLENNVGLALCGGIGTGKTFSAMCIANALIDNCIPVMITSFPEILNSSEDKVSVARKINRYKLVVIDDLGAERSSPYALEVIRFIVDERYKSGNPIIITTNLSPDEIYKNKVFEYARVYDRISEMCIPILFDGDSLRKERAEKKAKIAKKLFEG